MAGLALLSNPIVEPATSMDGRMLLLQLRARDARKIGPIKMYGPKEPEGQCD
jgi:hypothetical protein